MSCSSIYSPVHCKRSDNFNFIVSTLVAGRAALYDMLMAHYNDYRCRCLLTCLLASFARWLAACTRSSVTWAPLEPDLQMPWERAEMSWNGAVHLQQCKNMQMRNKKKKKGRKMLWWNINKFATWECVIYKFVVFMIIRSARSCCSSQA